MNRICELHDSRIADISTVGGDVTIDFSALYIHESIGRPGIDRGQGYYLKASLKICDAIIEGVFVTPTTISDGSTRLGNAIFENTIPLNPEIPAETELNLEFTSGTTLCIRGQSYSISLGEKPPSFVEHFPGITDAAQQDAAANP